MALKKSIFKIKLVERLTTIDRDTKNKMYNGLFNNKIESIMIINAWSLLKSFSNKAGFITVNKTIR